MDGIPIAGCLLRSEFDFKAAILCQMPSFRRKNYQCHKPIRRMKKNLSKRKIITKEQMHVRLQLKREKKIVKLG